MVEMNARGLMQIAHCTLTIANACHSKLSYWELIWTVRYKHRYKSYHSLWKEVVNVNGSLHEAGAGLAVSELYPSLLCHLNCVVLLAVQCAVYVLVIDSTRG